uniref:Pleckstrin homology domain containing, family O member 1a n=1 Tax=Myripristis murdjan TaxID=586833 RepID=A0A667Y8G8_9TELE
WRPTPDLRPGYWGQKLRPHLEKNLLLESVVNDERKAQEVFDLADYERSEELRKAKSRSKKNHSRFTVLRCRQPGNTVPNLVFLAVSPEEKESWVNALNLAIVRAKNRILDEVTIEEDSVLVHPTRDRAKIPHGRRLPTRGHLMAVASTSAHGVLTLDLVAEEDGALFSPDPHRDSWENSFRVDLQGAGSGAGPREVGGRQRAGTDVSKLRASSREPRVKTGSLPRASERCWAKGSQQEAPQGQVTSATAALCCSSPLLQSLIAQKMQRAQELLEEMRLQPVRFKEAASPKLRGPSGSPRSNKELDSPVRKAPDSPPCVRGVDSPHGSETDSPRLRSSRESPGGSHKNSPSLSRSFDSPQPGPGSPLAKAAELLRQKSFDSSHSAQSKTLDDRLLTPPLSPPSLLSEEESEVERRRAEAERLLEEAVSSWKEAQEVLQEVKELQSQTLRRQRRRTYEKMTPAATSGSPTATENFSCVLFFFFFTLFLES